MPGHAWTRGSGAHKPSPEAEHRSRFRAFTFCAQQSPDSRAPHEEVQILAR